MRVRVSPGDADNAWCTLRCSQRLLPVHLLTRHSIPIGGGSGGGGSGGGGSGGGGSGELGSGGG